MSESLAAVYLPIIPDASKIAPGVHKALGGVKQNAEKDGAGIGSKLSSGISKTLKTGAVATGAAVAGVLGTAMAKGMQRLTAIDSAEAKLAGLGHTAGGVSSIMSDALASVKGTAFGLGDAASAAASAVASGVKPGEDLQRTLKLMGDAAAIAGTDLGSMASIFNKVASTGKLQGDVLNQLGERGIPIIQLLAQEMGVTSEEVAKLASQGKIGFAELQNAIESGMGGAALAAGDTFVGAMDNAGAALGRLGAAAIDPFFEDAKGGIKAFTGAIDSLTDRVGPAAQALRDWLGPAAGSVVDYMRDLAGEASSLGPVLNNSVSAFSQLASTAMSLAPSLGTIAAELIKVTGAISVATWETLLAALTGTAAVADATLVPALNLLAGVLESSELAAVAFGAALLGLTKGKAILDGLGKVAKPISTAATNLTNYASALGEVGASVSSVSKAHPEMTKLGIATKLLGDNGRTGFSQITAGADSARQRVTAFGDAHRLAAVQAKAQALASTDAFTTIDRMGSQAWHGTVAAASDATRGMATAVGGLKGTVTSAFTGMKGAATGLMNAMGGPWGVAMAGAAVAVGLITTAYGEAKQSAENMARAASSAVKAQRELAQEVAGTTGAIGEDGMAAATELATSRLEQFYEEGQKGRGVTLVLREIAARIPFVSKGFYDATESARAAAGSYKILEERAGELDYTMEDVARVAAEGGPKFAELRQAVLDTGDGSEKAAEQLDQMRAEQQKLVDQARQVTPAQAEMSQAIQDIADKAGTAETRVENYWRALQKLTGTAPDLTEANANLREELDSLADKFNVAGGEATEFAGATLDAQGNLDTLGNSASGAVHSALSDLASRMQEAAIAGGDVNEIWTAAQPALQGLAESSGLGYDAIRQLAEQMGMTPRELMISAEVAADPAIAQAHTLKTMLESTPDIVGTEMFVTGGPEAMKVLDDAKIKYEVLNSETGQIRITAVDDGAMQKLDDLIGKKIDLDSLPPSAVEAQAITEDAQAALDDIARQLGDVDGTTASPGIDVDPIAFQYGLDGANQQLTDFDFRFVSATADLDRVPLDGSATLAHGTLDEVAGRRPTPLSDLDNALLGANADAAHGTLNVLDGARPKPIADLNNQPLRDGVTESRNWIQRLIDDFNNFALNIRLNVVRSIRDIFSSEGAARGGTIGALAAGGSIRDLTAGGQLPTTGPGTNVVDGFMGVDRGGVPIVRVDAGEEVINRKQAQRHRSLLKAINWGDPRVDDLPGFDTGGTIGSREGLDRALREAKSSHDIGARYLWGGISREAADCSGFVGRVAWAAQGRDPDSAGRMGTTATMMAGQWPGFKRGRTGPFIVGVNSAHMAATLDGIPVESGGDVGGPSIGRGDGANDPQFTEHWYLDHARFSPPYANRPSVTEESEALSYGDDGTTRSSTGEGDARNVALSPEGQRAAESASQDKDHPLFGTGADSWSGLGGNLAKAAVSGQIASLLKVLGIPDQLPPLVKAGKTWYQQVDDDASKSEIKAQDEAVVEAAESTETVEAPAAGPVDDGTPQSAGRRAVADRGWDTGAQWDALDYIYTKESNWDPHATNPSSGAFGIPQFNPVSGTLQQYLPDRSTDPFVQVTAGAQYIEDRYGDPIAAQEFWKANQWYDRGGVARGKGHMLKNTLEPERVLSPEQTRAFEDLVFNKLDDLAGLAESVVSSGVSSAVGAGAGMADMVMPGAGAMLSPLGGPAGDIAGWYAGEVTDNLIQTGATFARDISGIVGSQLDALSPVKLPLMDRPMPAAVPTAVPSTRPSRPVGRAVSADGGGVHFHVADMHTAMTKARRIAADEARGLIGV